MSLQVTITITDAQEKCLSHDLLDIEDWISKAVENKIYSCKKRLLLEAHGKLINDPEVSTMPADETELISTYTGKSYYKDRVARDAAK